MGLCKITDGLLGICIIALSLLAAIIRRRWSGGGGRSESCKLPQGTLGLPFLGETLAFISSAYSPRPESFMDKRRLRYGKVFKSHIFGSPTIVSTDPEVTRFVLQSDARTFVPTYPRSLTELIGKSSILLVNGGVQRRLHGLIGSFLKSPHLKAQVTRDMQRYVDAATARWHDGHLVHVQDDTKLMAFQVLVRALMSMEPGDDMQFLMQQFKEFIAGLISLPVKMPGTRLYRSLQAKKKLVRMIQGIVEERRRRRDQEEEEEASPSSSPPPPPRDVLEALLGDNSGQLTDELICDNMIDLMIPGEDSVPLLMTLAVKFLSDCPLALRQLEFNLLGRPQQEENMELMRKKYSQSGELCWMDYVSLPFTQNVITETLRLGNINYGTMRKAMRDVEIKGHLIPKGWCVLTYFRSVHLDEELYKDPYEFNPWRWQEKDAGTCHYFTPFGGGQRLCPGLDLARLEASIFLHHLLANFTWVAEIEDTVVNFPTVRMKGRMPIRVTRKLLGEEERARLYI